VYDTPELMSHVLDELSAYELERPGPLSLVHGDAHQGNSFLRADGQRVWHDWQLVRAGSPIRDVSYFVLSSLTVEERRSADRDLVEHWRQRLIATGADPAPSRDDAWQQFLRWPGYGTQAWLGNINQWGQSNGAEMVRRHFAASEDYDTVGLLTKGKRPRRAYVAGEGAYRLPRALQREHESRQR
jgi:aminoglycoside phosphotransferase (APT) family kinase protein